MKSITLAALVFIHTACTAFAVPASLLGKPDSWFLSPEGRNAVRNVLAWQSASGSWPKNRDHASNNHRHPRRIHRWRTPRHPCPLRPAGLGALP